MNGNRAAWKKDLFSACLKLDRDSCRTLLERECADDPELRVEIEELLDSHEQSDTLIDHGPSGYGQSLFNDEFSPGDAIGPFIVVRRLGAGGMGVVYLAFRPDQKTGRVAVKVAKRGMDSEEFLRRFSRERDILASLQNHPNIAHFQFADITAQRVPYLVMEYIEGSSIDLYCRQRNLDLKEILGLFLLVCGAVQAAHQRTIVHRDLKPGNILVTEDGVPKLLDFGIAKALQNDGSLDSVSLVRDLGLMTPRYSSPEQVGGSAPDVRMDVYSLGVILYELIAGVHPLSIEGLPQAEAIQRIREGRHAAPSVIPPGGLNRMPKSGEQRRDLDNILLKALHRDLDRRYGSVEQFASDIRCYLNDQPVTACADRVRYRIGKFVRRHRALVAVSVAFATLVMASTAAVTWQAHVARAERNVAQRRFSDLHSLARWLVFDFHDRIQNLHGATEARRLLIERAVGYLDTLSREVAGDVGLEREIAESYLKLGDVMGYPNDANLGDRNAALSSYRKALAIWSSLSGRASGTRREVAVVYQRIGEMQVKTGQAGEGLDNERKAAQILETLVRGGDHDPLTRRALATADVKLGEFYETRREAETALQWYRMAKEIFDVLRHQTPGDRTAIRDSSVMDSKFGDVNRTLGHMDDALASYRSSMELRELAFKANGENREAARDLATIYDRVATIYADTERLEDAITFERKTLGIDLKTLLLDPENSDSKRDVANDYSSLGDLMAQQGHWSEALAQHKQAYLIRQQLHKSSPSDSDITAELADSAQFLGLSRAKTGDTKAAADLAFARGLVAELRQSDPSNAVYFELLAKVHLTSGQAMRALGAQDDARTFYRKSIELFGELKKTGKSSFEGDTQMKEALQELREMAAPKPTE